MTINSNLLPIAGGDQETVYLRGISCSKEENAGTRENDWKSFGLNFTLYDFVFCCSMCKNSNLDGEIGSTNKIKLNHDHVYIILHLWLRCNNIVASMWSCWSLRIMYSWIFQKLKLELIQQILPYCIHDLGTDRSNNKTERTKLENTSLGLVFLKLFKALTKVHSHCDLFSFSF